MWLTDARRRGLRFYVSKETIGRVSFETSTWFSGVDEKFFYGKGAFYQAVHPRLKYLWMLYFVLRTRKTGNLSFAERMRWMRKGCEGYIEMQPFRLN